ncbi:MAG: ABC transporter substrate-binding protein [Planctomycetes bacterium]|nr:ABC transporter substrate-binding protein [Planctomycetota bacterium]MCC7170315.1 ABC transporter substrate-binding protein [Planctomycetota bacterium]
MPWNDGDRPPKRSSKCRIVSLLPAATDIVLAIGAEHDLVAVSHLCAQPEGRTVPRVVSTTVDSDALSMPAIHAAVREASEKRVSLYQLDEDAIRATEPTTILSQGVCPVCAVPPEQAQALSTESDPQCAELVVLTPRTLADVASDIRRVGIAVGRSREAEIVAQDFERRIDAVRASSVGKPKPRVVVLEWFDPLWVSGEWIVEMVEAAGGESLLVGKNEPSREVAWSDLVAADPDVIVLAACSMDVERAARELGALRDRPEWDRLRAVLADRVFLLDGEHHFSAPGPKLARGVEVLGAILADEEARLDESECGRVRGRE